MNIRSVQEIVRSYGLIATDVMPIEKGYRNESHPLLLSGGRRANLILYKNEAGIVHAIRRVHRVSNHLKNRDLPVRYPMDARIARVTIGGRPRYVALYNYLPGRTISWEAYTERHIKLLGKTMSDMHAALRDYPADKLPPVTRVYAEIYARMERYFAGDDVRTALAGKLGLSVSSNVIRRISRLLDYCRTLSGQQALHMDFVRSNILFAPDSSSPFGLQISGILDLEKAAYGHPVFDIARTYAFLLIDCKYKAPVKVRKYFLYSGYNKRGAQKLDRPATSMRSMGKPLLECLTEMFLLYDFYKFLRHNPYEDLPANEHFVRTRNLLLERGVITTTSIGSLLEQTLLQ